MEELMSNQLFFYFFYGILLNLSVISTIYFTY